MAGVSRVARGQMGRLCAVREWAMVSRVAGFRTTSQVVADRAQGASMSNVVPAASAWEDFGATYPAWSRDTLSGYSRGFATKDGADNVTGAAKTSSSSDDIGEEMRVDTMVRDELEEPEGGPEPGLKEKAKQAVSKIGEKMNDAGKAIKGSTDNKAADKVGDTVKGAGDTLKDKGSNQKGLGNEDVVTS
ncbi:hypothetical protein KC19_VG330900 [Ceratodon purpureus]|uniref:Uncharacterized protein n=1 Tax=Ceratodon purpureus TaxID=3225 RepID=A0A8T0HWV9_CERPU|nr:hypothetical protein KC19_VG330900 [Ceratodon purpureus]